MEKAVPCMQESERTLLWTSVIKSVFLSHHPIQLTLSEPPTVDHEERIMLHITFHQCYLKGNKVSKSEGTRKAGQPLHCSTCAFELKVIKISPWLLKLQLAKLGVSLRHRIVYVLVGSKQQRHVLPLKLPIKCNYLATNALTCDSNLRRNVETAHNTSIHISHLVTIKRCNAMQHHTSQHFTFC